MSLPTVARVSGKSLAGKGDSDVGDPNPYLELTLILI